MRVGMTLRGLDELVKITERAGLNVRPALEKAVFAEANAVLNESKKIVPVDTGALKSSGRVERPVVNAAGVTVEVSYGGAAAPYALYVHEDPTASHAPGKSFKFLEIPAMARRPVFVQNVKERFITYVRRGV
jgi:hypothetical protein